MDCRRFRELLDAYLCDELAVETNDALLRHAESCAACQGELTARRELRRLLAEAWEEDNMSAQGHAKLRAQVREAARAETAPPLAAVSVRPREAARGKALMRSLTPRRPLYLPLAAALVFALTAGGAYLYLQSRTARAAALSPQLWEEAVGDHHACGNIWLKKQGAIKDEVQGAAAYDSLLRDLHHVAAPYAQGLELRAAHVCSFGRRRFAHLAYKQSERVFSLLVTRRDSAAMLRGVVPDDDGTKAGLQHAADAQSRYQVSAYQTARYVILVVADRQQDAASADLTRRLALPLSDHLRRAEQASGGQPNSR